MKKMNLMAAAILAGLGFQPAAQAAKSWSRVQVRLGKAVVLKPAAALLAADAPVPPKKPYVCGIRC